MITKRYTFLVTSLITVALMFGVVWRFSPETNEHRKSFDNDEIRAKKYMQFDDWLNGKFSARSFYPYWVSGAEYIYRQSSGAIMKKNIETEEEVALLKAEAWNGVTDPYSYSVSSDLNYVAISYARTDGYAHYVRTFSVAIFSTIDSSAITIPSFPDKGIQKLKWDPAGHKLAYVYGFNIYVVTNFSVDSIAVTSDGVENIIFNGISDWLYSVEITDDDALLWWSQNGTYLAYARIDQDGVKDFEFSLFAEQQYPTMVKFPYPKPGTPIPKTSTWIIDTNIIHLNSSPQQAEPSSTVTDWIEYYLNSAIWRGDNVFTPTWKYRYENRSVSENCAMATTWTCTHATVMEDQSDSGWLGHYKPANLVNLRAENEYMTVLSDANGFPHIAIIDVDANTKTFRSSGNFEVTDTGSGYSSIYFYDEVNDFIYFTSTEDPDNLNEGLPRIRHMWKVKGHGDDFTRTCITCDLNNEYKNRCNWVKPSFSPNGSFIVVNCGGTGNGVPISTLHRVSSDDSISFVRVVEENTDLQNSLDEYYFRTREYGSIELPGVEGQWYYAIHKPPNFDENKKYPMLVQVYSGPAYQEVTERFSVSWKDYVASSLGVIVMSFDGRGTGYRGDEIMHQVYRKLGQYEPADQIVAAKKLGEINNYIDKDRTAIWGWSYGGYATTRTIGEDSNNVFKCGFAVAPVTDWHYYHTIYTERYMGSPDENKEGYSMGTTMQKYDNFKLHQYYVIHGTADENVHFQNSAELTKSLVEHDVPFGAYFAADDDHGMGKITNNYRNVYKIITRQMCRCFDLNNPDTGVICGSRPTTVRKQKRKKM